MINPAKIIVYNKTEAPAHYPIEKETVISGKKAGGAAAIQIGLPAAETQYGKIILKDNIYFYENAADSQNIYYNDILIGSDELEDSQRIPLEDGDVLRISSESEQYVLIFRSKFKEESEWRIFSLDPKDSIYYLSCKEGSSGDEIREKEEKADQTSIPEHYGILCYENSQWLVSDNNTRFGVHVNGQRIAQKRALKCLDVIRIGNTLFLYKEGQLSYNHREAFQNQLTIHIKERDVWNFFHRQSLLKDINLSINPGEMVLILGGSGAGKTTFINAVMGYEKAEGQILKDGIDIYKNYDKMKYEIGYVPQEDLLRLEDFVSDTLQNAAELKLPKDTSPEEIKKRVAGVLTVMGLERESEALVSKLSGGQRKRLSIALEYIADPSLFFLDEPDSGLDGVAARQLMENLRQIADENKMVLIITHTPDRVIDLFDKVIVLAKGNEDNTGHLTFFGTPKEAEEFFEVDNMEGIIRKIDRTDEGGEGQADFYIEKYKKIEGNQV